MREKTKPAAQLPPEQSFVISPDGRPAKVDHYILNYAVCAYCGMCPPLVQGDGDGLRFDCCGTEESAAALRKSGVENKKTHERSIGKSSESDLSIGVA